MKCDICRERPAVIFVQQVTRGSSVELHLCEQCAKERGYKTQGNSIDISLGGLFAGALAGSERLRETVRACPECGTALEDLRKTRRAGCASCYREFGAEIVSIMRNEGYALGYDGPLPKKLEAFQATPSDSASLKKELQKAIEAEDYELAAYYRDRIRSIGGAS